MSNIGLITEQGDLGLGFDPLKKKDEAIYEQSLKDKERDNAQIINEEKK